MDLYRQLEQYVPVNEQEERDKELILSCMARNSDIFYRSCLPAHMTASAWVVNPSRNKVLMVWHNIYHSWSWPGGHADGESDLLSVALREVREECGVKTVKPVSEDILSLEVLTVNGHIKKGVYVPSHLHLNVTYLLEASDQEETAVKPDENSGVAWFSPEEAINASDEPWFRERIYPKLNRKAFGS